MLDEDANQGACSFKARLQILGVKRNPRAPDYKCRDRACDGVIWPPKGEKAAERSESAKAEPFAGETEEIPFGERR